MSVSLRKSLSAIPLVAVFILTAAISPGTPSAQAAMGDNPRFAEVKKKLDENGSFYLYIDVKGKLRALFDGIKDAVPSEGDAIGIKLGMTLAEEGLDSLGIFGIEDIGISEAKVGENYQSKVFIRVPGERKGLFKIAGGPAHPIDMIEYAPPDAAVFRTLDLDFSELYDLTREIAKKVGGAVLTTQIDNAVKTAGEMLGWDLEKMIRSLSGKLSVILRFHPTKRITIPDSGTPPVTVPLPQIAVLAGVKDSTLYDSLTSLLGTKEVILKSETGSEIKRMPIPSDSSEEFPYTPEVVTDGKNVMLASHSEWVDLILETLKGKPNLSSDEDFKKVTKDFPTAANELAFISPRFGKEIRGVVDQIKSQTEKKAAFDVDMVASFIEATPLSKGLALERVNEVDGLYLLVSSPSDKGFFSLLEKAAPIWGAIAEKVFPGWGNGEGEGDEEESGAEGVDDSESAETEIGSVTAP
jgi:hypothetical protein